MLSNYKLIPCFFFCVGLSIGNTRPHLLLLSSSIDPVNLIIYYYYIALRGDYLMNETVNALNVCCISIFKLCFIFIGVVFLSCFHSFFLLTQILRFVNLFIV